MITGGLGGLGLLFAKWMVDQGARNIVLTSRSGRVPDSAEAILETLRGDGASIDVVAAEHDTLSRVEVDGTDPGCIPGPRARVHLVGALSDGNTRHGSIRQDTGNGNYGSGPLGAENLKDEEHRVGWPPRTGPIGRRWNVEPGGDPSSDFLTF